MTKFEQIQTQFKGLIGTIDIYIDSNQFFFIDVDDNRLEGVQLYALSCGCCHDYQNIENDLSSELDYISDEDFEELIEQLNKLKSEQ